MTFQYNPDEWQYVRGSPTAERAAAFFGLTLATAIVERLPDDPRWPNEPHWRVKSTTPARAGALPVSRRCQVRLTSRGTHVDWLDETCQDGYPSKVEIVE